MRVLDKIAKAFFSRKTNEFFCRRGKCFTRHGNVERIELAVDGNGQLGRSIALDDAEQVSAFA